MIKASFQFLDDIEKNISQWSECKSFVAMRGYTWSGGERQNSKQFLLSFRLICCLFVLVETMFVRVNSW